MKDLLIDPVANLARLEEFPMVDRPRVCRRCNFRKLCFPKTADEVPATAVTEPVQRDLGGGAPDEPS